MKSNFVSLVKVEVYPTASTTSFTCIAAEMAIVNVKRALDTRPRDWRCVLA